MTPLCQGARKEVFDTFTQFRKMICFIQEVVVPKVGAAWCDGGSLLSHDASKCMCVWLCVRQAKELVAAGEEVPVEELESITLDAFAAEFAGVPM